ncbi:UDP-N-acetyl-D-mannosaminuronic acid dehydrogenase [Hydrogenispora ethanolica]|uniref:UDP-N-acetyl-D-mannosaminuronic acid dehydrogenase n=1 Tax=Hydrogenispora ethanolica TaxID=1082276 RepID=A0A4R1SB38_HYDET|nr:nucleotide sugar dehydrogenase [Hydrogenispora ethanolica]TCL76756.1 UDP-N-acetyl-D-mannosaminuronic acid dehydrogenase [Hydrogenispora ethanolica]
MERQAALPRLEVAVKRRVCIFGQGFVGLPLSLSYSLRDCQVMGVDADPSLVSRLNDAATDLQEHYLGQSIQTVLARQLQQGRYLATTDAPAALRECSDIIVTVGIPIVQGEPSLLHLKTACQTIGRDLKRDDLVLIRSTVIPGTTEELILPLLEAESGLRAGRDFYLAYAPERIAEGRAFEEIADMPTLVAGINAESAARAKELLAEVCQSEIIVADSIRAIETAKLFENLQRDANIAIAQELARFTEAMGLDILEVIRLANTHRRVNLLQPGPGVGGYCIPNAYHYLAKKAESLGVELPLMKLCREKNAALPEFFAAKLEGLLQTAGKSLPQSQIAVLGLAMKDCSNDDRISPPVDICHILLARGAAVRAYDPLVTTAYPFKVPTLPEALRNADALLILARQPGFEALDCATIVELMKPGPVCLDTRSVIGREDAAGHDLVYWRI